MSINVFFEEIEENKDYIYLNEYQKWNKGKCIAFLKECDDKYHNGEVSEISDTTYDIIKSYAKSKWSKDPYFKTVGSEKIKGVKIKHRYILGSLEKYKPDINDSQYIGKWLSQYNKEDYIIITPKLDGLSIFSEYDSSELNLSSTRGDGVEGQEITKKSKLFVPLKIDVDGMCCFRGEILLTGEDHIQLGFKNRRNGASGLIGSDSLNNCDKLKILFYEFIDSDNINYDPGKMSEEERLMFIKERFPLNSIWWNKIKVKDISCEYLINLLNEWNKEYLDRYDFDGLVLTFNDSVREDTYTPENKVSFKFNEEKALGRVKEVKWETSRTGRIIPVVILEDAVELSGALIQKASGYNAKFILDNNINTGAKIEICRSGNVIPKILRVIED